MNDRVEAAVSPDYLRETVEQLESFRSRAACILA